MNSYTRDRCMAFLAYGEHKNIRETKIRRWVAVEQSVLGSEGKRLISGLEERQALIWRQSCESGSLRAGHGMAVLARTGLRQARKIWSAHVLKERSDVMGDYVGFVHVVFVYISCITS